VIIQAPINNWFDRRIILLMWDAFVIDEYRITREIDEATCLWRHLSIKMQLVDDVHSSSPSCGEKVLV
jgi:hypothetical protein